MKPTWIYVLVGLILGLAVLAEANRTAPVDWTPSYVRHDKVPYGTYVLFDRLRDLFPDQKIVVLERTAYQELRDDTLTDPTTYVFINTLVDLGDEDLEELLDFAARGNAVFIASTTPHPALLDTLGLEIEYSLSAPFSTDSTPVNFVSPALREQQPYKVPPQDVGRTVAIRSDATPSDSAAPADTTISVLGVDGHGRINFVRVAFGEGAFYLNFLPALFTNRFVLSSEYGSYAFKALSYLPVQTVAWDERYKDGRRESKTPLRYVLRTEPLRWAYWTLIIGGALFVVIASRRRQRIIPVVEPPRNTTLEFVETVGELFHQHGNVRAIAQKRIQYFTDYVHVRLGLPTAGMGDELIDRIAERAGVDHEIVRQVFDKIRHIERTVPNQTDLMALSDALENFYGKSQR